MADATALERARLTIRGVRAELVLEDGHLTLSKDGPPSTSLSFAVDQVRGTVLETSSRGGRGWIHVAVVGGTLVPPGELAAMSDPYTIPLTSRSAVTARRLARIVEKHLHERGLPPEPTFAASALERGRFSSGVALTQAPGAARTVLDLSTDDGEPPPSPSTPPPSLPPPSPSRNGSSLATERSATSSRTSDTSAWPGDDEGEDPRAVRIAAAEAAIDERAVYGSGPLGTSVEPAVDEPATEPAGTPGGWVKPSGPSQLDATDEGASPAPAPSSVVSSAPPSPSVPGSSPKPTAPPPLTPPTVVGREIVAELRQLGELYASGVLTDAEFEQAKARVLH